MLNHLQIDEKIKRQKLFFLGGKKSIFIVEPLINYNQSISNVCANMTHTQTHTHSPIKSILDKENETEDERE